MLICRWFVCRCAVAYVDTRSSALSIPIPTVFMDLLSRGPTSHDITSTGTQKLPDRLAHTHYRPSTTKSTYLVWVLGVLHSLHLKHLMLLANRQRKRHTNKQSRGAENKDALAAEPEASANDVLNGGIGADEGVALFGGDHVLEGDEAFVDGFLEGV